MTLLDSWTRGEHSADGTSHPTYRKGSGPGVIVIHEVPGLTPAVIGFGEEVVAAGFTVVLPHLFGTPEAPVGPRSMLSTFPKVCVSREFTTLAAGKTSRSPDGCAACPDRCTRSSVARASAPWACASPAGSRSR